MPEQLPSYVFLVRHAKRKRSWDMPEAQHGMEKWGARAEDSQVLTLTSRSGGEGLPRTFSLAGSLCDQLELMNVTIAQILHSEHLVAQQTAQVYEKVLQKRFKSNVLMTLETALTPAGSNLQHDEEKLAHNTISQIKAILSEARQPEKRPPGLIVIGHQPSLTQIAQGLLESKKLPAGILPIGNSEIACIRLGGSPALLWLLTEKSKELSAELKAKITSKFDLAKFILGALILNLSLYLTSDLWKITSQMEALLLGGAMVFAFLAFEFTIATLFAYDQLNMPTEFWGDTGKPDATPRRWSINRPPSSYQLILFYEMIHVWKRFFIPAVVFATLSLGMLGAMLAYRFFVLPGAGAGAVSLLIGAVLLGLIVSMAIYEAYRPKLGFDD